MNVRVCWDDENHTIIRYDFETRWTWEEFQAATQNAFAMIHSVEHVVDTISNFKPGMALPTNSLFYFRRAMANSPHNRGISVVVSSSAFIQKMITTFTHFNKQLGKRLMVTDTLDDAREIIRKRRT